MKDSQYSFILFSIWAVGSLVCDNERRLILVMAAAVYMVGYVLDRMTESKRAQKADDPQPKS